MPSLNHPRTFHHTGIPGIHTPHVSQTFVLEIRSSRLQWSLKKIRLKDIRLEEGFWSQVFDEKEKILFATVSDSSNAK